VQEKNGGIERVEFMANSLEVRNRPAQLGVKKEGGRSKKKRKDGGKQV